MPETFFFFFNIVPTELVYGVDIITYSQMQYINPGFMLVKKEKQLYKTFLGQLEIFK